MPRPLLRQQEGLAARLPDGSDEIGKLIRDELAVADVFVDDLDRKRQVVSVGIHIDGPRGVLVHVRGNRIGQKAHVGLLRSNIFPGYDAARRIGANAAWLEALSARKIMPQYSVTIGQTEMSPEPVAKAKILPPPHQLARRQYVTLGVIWCGTRAERVAADRAPNAAGAWHPSGARWVRCRG